jgi:hypothetical protein
MKLQSRSSLAVLGCAVALLVSGCFVAAPLENEVTWAVKAATSQLTEATAAEWQAVATKVDELVPEVDVSLSEEQAEGIVVFVQENEINGVQDIEELLEQAQTDPSSIVIPDGFLELFSGFGEVDLDRLVGTLQG